ncbi:hypothetical protein ACHAWU_007547 [Discostella pseudostelligera]|jgi:hypothetical protein|uniref:TLC domain-containing protein n=1 Tax=Discostella pseudostelligera TaxID=259834 RepID=A0ABD3MA74_9STRA
MFSASSLLPVPIPPSSFLYGFIGGAISYLSSRALSPLLTSTLGSSSFQRNVNSLDKAKRYHYHSLLPSTIHALIQIIGTYSFVFYGSGEESSSLSSSSSSVLSFDERTIVPYGTTHLGPSIYMGIFVGYLVTDVICAPSLSSMGYPFVLHHVAATICWTYCACYRVMQPVAMLLQFNELSTPLMNLRQMLLTAGYDSSGLSVTVSSVAFFVAFGMVRVAPLPSLVYNWIFRDYEAIRSAIGLGGAICLSLFFAVNALLQCGWFCIMCQKLMGMVAKEKPKAKKS